MSLFQRTETRSVDYQALWGSGQPTSSQINVERALSLIPVYASVRVLADSIASLPIKQYKRDGESRISADSAQFLRPTPKEPTLFSWVHQAVSSLALTGNAVGLKLGVDRSGAPSRIVWLNPARVYPQNNSTLGDPKWTVDGEPVPWESILHIPLFQRPGELWGMSPIKAFSEALDLGLMAQKFGRDFFKSGSVPSGILKTDGRVSEEDASLLKRRFKESAKNHDVSVLGVGVDYKPLAVPPEEAQFVETIRANASLIAAIYGVPADDVGGSNGDSKTYVNDEQRSIRFTNVTLRPWVVRLESAFNMIIPEDEFVKFNIDSMIRTDLLTRFQTYSIARNIGLNSIDELRAKEDLKPLENGQGSQATPLQLMKGATQDGPTAN